MPSIDRVVMYGGLDASGVVRDSTWVWDPANGWLMLIEHSAPGPRSSTRMVYSVALGKIVLFGGKATMTGPPVNDDTWLFDGTSWVACSSCTTRPPARISEGLEYYPGALSGVLMFGGLGLGAVSLNDTWILKGNPPNWVPCPVVQCPASSLPAPRVSPTLGFDSAAGNTLMFGGNVSKGATGETWTFAYGRKPAWKRCPVTQCPTGVPSARSGQRMAYDSTLQRILMFGAGLPLLGNETWFWSGNPGAWVQCGPGNGCEDVSPRPAPRCCVGFTWDSVAQKAIVFGGGYDAAPQSYGDTWTWDAVSGWQCASLSCST
jgi:hypothetical protein